MCRSMLKLNKVIPAEDKASVMQIRLMIPDTAAHVKLGTRKSLRTSDPVLPILLYLVISILLLLIQKQNTAPFTP